VQTRAVTIDAHGTLVTLRDPVPALRHSLASRGVERTREETTRAFAAEVVYYVPRSHEGRDEATLARLRRECTAVFLAALDAELDPDEFAPAFVDSLVFETVPGAAQACRMLAGAGLRLAVVSNWDVGLGDLLASLGLERIVDTVVSSAEAGEPKPSPAPFRLALARLEVEPTEAVHIGDGVEDEEGAHAAGMRFEPAPLADAAKRILA